MYADVFGLYCILFMSFDMISNFDSDSFYHDLEALKLYIWWSSIFIYCKDVLKPKSDFGYEHLILNVATRLTIWQILQCHTPSQS